MSVSRRGFLGLVGGRASASGAALAARGREAEHAHYQQQSGEQGRAGGAGQGAGQQGAGRAGGQGGRGGGRGNRPELPPGVEEIKINSNENPLGPGKAALDAILGKFPEAGRYPFNSSPKDGDLVDTIAKKQGAKPENIVLGAGSQEILKSAMRAFVTPYRALTIAAPTFENCTGYARKMKWPLNEIKVDSACKLDIDGMIATARGAGLIFFNNPNNPTATVHGLKTVTDFVERVRRISPDTVILIDEAYHDYVTDPAYQTAIPLALATPNVFVARTFSKAYGMAGLRMGYCVGHPETIRKMADWDSASGTSSLNVLAMAAGVAAIEQDPSFITAERNRNKAVRELAMKWFSDRGMKPTDSQANFMFVNIGRPAKDFRDACKTKNVLVARDFPPFEKTHCRISFGTMEEMQKAVKVFEQVLQKKSTAAA